MFNKIRNELMAQDETPLSGEVEMDETFVGGKPRESRSSMMRLARMDDLFDSAWLKWGWAVRESKTLEEDLMAFVMDEKAQRLNTVACNYEPQRHGFILKVDTLAPMPPQIELRLSTVAHLFRSCLDNLAWAVVARGKRPQSTLSRDERRAISFPVCDTWDEFKRCCEATKKSPSRLPGVLWQDERVIRRAQPYRYRKRERSNHVLSILTTFNNIDKHRTLQPLRFWPERLHYEIVEKRDCQITRTPLIGAAQMLEIDTEIVRFPARKIGPDPYIRVEYELATLPVINKRISLANWIGNMADAMGSLLLDFAEPPRAKFKALGLPRLVKAP
jgi:hypothetical protein